MITKFRMGKEKHVHFNIKFNVLSPNIRSVARNKWEGENHILVFDLLEILFLKLNLIILKVLLINY